MVGFQPPNDKKQKREKCKSQQPGHERGPSPTSKGTRFQQNSYGSGSKLYRRGKPQVLVHGSTLPGQPILEFRSHRQAACTDTKLKQFEAFEQFTQGARTLSIRTKLTFPCMECCLILGHSLQKGRFKTGIFPLGRESQTGVPRFVRCLCFAESFVVQLEIPGRAVKQLESHALARVTGSF